MYYDCRRRRQVGQRRRRVNRQDTALAGVEESESGGSDSSSKENHTTTTSTGQRETRNLGGGVGRRWMEFGGCVYVGALPHQTRVSEFKAEVRYRNVNPLRVLWRGNHGFAFLNFRTLEDAELALDALHGLKVVIGVTGTGINFTVL